MGCGPETTTLDQNRLFVEHLGGLEDFAIGAEHRRTAQTELDKLQRHHPIVHVAKFNTAELDHVDLDATRRQHIEERLDQHFRRVIVEEGRVAQVHPDNAECLLLQRGLRIQHPNVHHDLARLVIGATLKLDSHPAVAFVAAAEAPGHHRVGKGKKSRGIATGRPQTLEVQGEFPVQHRLQASLRDVAVALTVDRITDLHVVGGDALGNRSRSATHPEKPTHHFLSRTDLSKAPIPLRVQVHLQGFMVGIDGFRNHASKVAGIMQGWVIKFHNLMNPTSIVVSSPPQTQTKPKRGTTHCT